MHPLSSQSQTSPKDQEATDKVMRKAEKQAEKSKRQGADESNVPTKKLTSARSPSPPGESTGAGFTLPVVEEDVEGQSVVRICGLRVKRMQMFCSRQLLACHRL